LENVAGSSVALHHGQGKRRTSRSYAGPDKLLKREALPGLSFLDKGALFKMINEVTRVPSLQQGCGPVP